MSVLIIDHNLCNIDSIVRAVEKCGGAPVVSATPQALEKAERLILPGVGNFTEAMTVLHTTGWARAITDAVSRNKIPLLGICLGMQLLATRGEEGGDTAGLDLIPGKVLKLAPADTKLRIPHVGWNEVVQRCADPIFNDVDNRKDFYFVHSYHFVPSDPETILSTTPYGLDLVSSIRKGNIYGMQFHPEKSMKAGAQLLRNFLA